MVLGWPRGLLQPLRNTPFRTSSPVASPETPSSGAKCVRGCHSLPFPLLPAKWGSPLPPCHLARGVGGIPVPPSPPGQPAACRGVSPSPSPPRLPPPAEAAARRAAPPRRSPCRRHCSTGCAAAPSSIPPLLRPVTLGGTCGRLLAPPLLPSFPPSLPQHHTASGRQEAAGSERSHREEPVSGGDAPGSGTTAAAVQLFLLYLISFILFYYYYYYFSFRTLAAGEDFQLFHRT